MFTPLEFRKTVPKVEFLVCTELLPAIRNRYGTALTLLEIPQVLRSEKHEGTIYFRRYDGDTYNNRWNEGNGGDSLGTELSSEMVRLLGDLQKIDIGWLMAQHAVGNTVEQSAFNLQRWLLSFQKEKTLALGMGILGDEFTRAEAFIKSQFQFTSRIFSNGDFYPRNLIKLPNRVVLVDWAYEAGYRLCYVDYLVNVAAFAFIHMWNNDPWQRKFISELRADFGIGTDDFRKAVLIKSFEQAKFWQRCAPHLVPAMVHQFKMALSGGIAS